jgi:beta-mannanase
MADGGRRNVLLAWEPWGIRFTDITTGKQNAYLNRLASVMLRFPYTVYVRPWPEMNANWSSWQPTRDGRKAEGGTPAEFVAAWRYLVTYFRDRRVTNLKFVFNPDASNWENNTPVPSIWPGTNYVDVLGIDGYNWGIDTAGDKWQTFDTIFTTMYGVLTHLDSTHPVWICETGSKEPTEEDDSMYPNESAPLDPHHSKGTWIREMLGTTFFPRIEAVVWFDKKKERDWPLTSSNDSLSAIRAYLAIRSRGNQTTLIGATTPAAQVEP